MWALVVGPVWAAVTLTREPWRSETTPPYVSPDLYDARLNALEREEFKRNRERARLRGMDAAMRWQAPLVEGCATTGSTTVRVAFAEDGVIRSVKAMKGADEALAACIAEAYEKTWLPVFHVEPSAVWTFTFDGTSAGAPLARAIDRDHGFNGIDFGAPADGVEGLTLESDADEVRYFGRAADYGRDTLFGAATTSISYGFTDPDGFCVAYARFSGESVGFTLRQGLNGRYGTSRVNPETQSWYWQGEDVLLELFPAGEGRLVLAVLDIDRARRAGILDTLPGEKGDRKFEVPRYLRKALPQ